MLATFIAAFGLGLVFNAAPGPVLSETIRHALRSGFRPALHVQLASIAGDAVWAMIGLSGASLLFGLDSLRVPIGTIGALYLVVLGYQSWQQSKRQLAADEPEDLSALGSPVRSGVFISLANPQSAAYWAALGSALGAIGISNPEPSDYLAFFMGFVAASVIWAIGCAWIVSRIARQLSPNLARLSYRICAVMFILLALTSLRNLRPTNRAESACEEAVPACSRDQLQIR